MFRKKFISVKHLYCKRRKVSYLKKLEKPTKSKSIKEKEVIKISAETKEMQRGGGGGGGRKNP